MKDDGFVLKPAKNITLREINEDLKGQSVRVIAKIFPITNNSWFIDDGNGKSTKLLINDEKIKLKKKLNFLAKKNSLIRVVGNVKFNDEGDFSLKVKYIQDLSELNLILYQKVIKIRIRLNSS
ncbi:MAG: hypothetical protein EAX96_06500 [Candidatus Lokiarchaeota archaeon]|nr:hypothetical protein [Candidatus Lokiarchaeota archaeon]